MTIWINCKRCGKAVRAIRSTRRYCGDKCRKYHSRELAGQTGMLSETSVKPVETQAEYIPDYSI